MTVEIYNEDTNKHFDFHFRSGRRSKNVAQERIEDLQGEEIHGVNCHLPEFGCKVCTSPKEVEAIELWREIRRREDKKIKNGTRYKITEKDKERIQRY